MALAQKGIDVRQTGTAIVFRAFLQTSAGALLGTGTTVISIIELQSDGTIKTYDFNDNTFKTTACTTPTLAMTHRPSNNAGTTTGFWTVALNTVTGFTVGGIYEVICNNSGASPTDQMREFQYGGAEGDLAVTSGTTGVAYLQTDTTLMKTQTITCAAGITVNVNVGTTQPLNFTGTAGSALVKGDAIDWNSVAVTGMPMPTYTQPAGFLAATFPTTVASTTNITAGTITTVTNLTNAPTVGDFTSTMKTSLNAATPVVTVSDKTDFSLTSAYDPAKTAAQQSDVDYLIDQLPNNFALLNIEQPSGSVFVSGDFSTTMKASLNASTPASIQSVTNIVSSGAITTSGGAVSSVLTLTTYTGNTPQTGDSFARIGATGSGLTSLASASNLATLQTTATTISTNLSNGTVTLASAYDAAKTAASQSSVNTLQSTANTINTNTSTIITDLSNGTVTLASAYDAAKTAASATNLATLQTTANTINTNLSTLTTTVGAAGVGLTAVSLSTAGANAVADVSRRRTQAHVEASTNGDTLDIASEYGMIQQLQQSDTTTHSGKLTVFKTDGTTELAQLDLTSDATADPITGIS